MEAVEYYASPSRKSAETCYRLTDSALQVEKDGRPSMSIALADVVQVDLIKRRGLGTCRIRTENGVCVAVESATTSPDGERVIQAADYAAWVDGLHERLTDIGKSVRFRGQDRRMLNTGLFLILACVLPPLVLFLHALAWGGDYGEVVAEALFWIFIPLVAGGLLLGVAKTIKGLARQYPPRVIPFELLPATGDHVAASSSRIGASARAVRPPQQVIVGPDRGERFARHSPFGDEEGDAEDSAEATPL